MHSTSQLKDTVSAKVTKAACSVEAQVAVQEVALMASLLHSTSRLKDTVSAKAAKAASSVEAHAAPEEVA